MGTVSIGTGTFNIYGLAADANTYFLAHSNADEWRDASTLTKNRALVTAARSFDRQNWVGTPTDLVTPQDLAWPRTGVTDRNGEAVDPNTTPDDVDEGNWEWALDLVKNGAIADATPGTNTKKTRSSKKVDVITVSTELELFRPTIGETARFPVAVMELIGLFLAGGDEALAFASGTDVESGFTDSDTDFGFSGIGIDGGANS